MPQSAESRLLFPPFAGVLERWDAQRQEWAPEWRGLDLLPDSVLLLRLRVSRGPLRSDTVLGLVCELFGSGSSPRNGQHGLP